MVSFGKTKPVTESKRKRILACQGLIDKFSVQYWKKKKLKLGLLREKL